MVEYKGEDIKLEHIYIHSKNRSRLKYSDDVVCFDVETTSLFNYNGSWLTYKELPRSITKEVDKEGKPTREKFNNLPKMGLVYIWQACVNDTVYYSRDFSLALKFFDVLEKQVDKMYVYVHNLGFEFVWLMNLFKPTKVFARKPLHPMKFEYKNIEFRCSYMLTRLSLANWGKQVGVKKLVGDLDYEIYRSPLTPMTKLEMAYCEHDILVMLAGIRKYIERYGHIRDIPLTQTGEVRREVSQVSIKNDYIYSFTKCQPSEKKLYDIMVNVTWGGETHANYLNSNEVILEDMDSADYKSSYPFNMATRLFPLTPFKKDIYRKGDEKRSYIMKLNVKDLESKYPLHSLSKSKVKVLDKRKLALDNGRLMKCKEFEMWITDIDYDIMCKLYDFKPEILDCYSSFNQRLPKEIARLIFDRFAKKTSLDGVAGMEGLYMQSKQFINAIYGMSLTKLVFENVLFHFNDEVLWEIKEPTNLQISDKLKKLQSQKQKNILPYQVGLYTIAFGRDILWDLLLSFDVYDVVYYDTDSCKKIKKPYQTKIINELNEKHYKWLKEAQAFYGFSDDIVFPKSPDGETKVLGKLEIDGEYSEFKTMGAKKYAYRSKKDGGLYITVSGLPKSAVDFLNNDINNFKEGVTVDDKHSNKNAIGYNYNQPIGVVLRDGYVTNLKYGAVVHPTTYKFTLSDDYSNLVGKTIDELEVYING